MIKNERLILGKKINFWILFSSQIPDIPEADTVIAAAFDLANGNHQPANGYLHPLNGNHQAVNSNNQAAFSNHQAAFGNNQAAISNHQAAFGNNHAMNGNHITAAQDDNEQSDELNKYRASLTISPKLNRLAI